MCKFKWKIISILIMVVAMAVVLSLVWWFVLRSDSSGSSAKSWILDWEETFNGTALNASRWTPGTSPLPWITLLDSTVAAGNVEVRNDSVYLMGRYSSGSYTSARLTSLLNVTAQKIIFRILAPKNYGTEVYLALAPMAVDCPKCLSILVMDSYGDTKSVVFGSVSYGSKNNISTITESTFVEGLANSFVEYGAEVTGDSVTLTINGKSFLAAAKNSSVDQQEYWKFGSTGLNIDMGLIVGREYSSRYNYSSGNAPDSTTEFPASIQIASVRVYSIR